MEEDKDVIEAGAQFEGEDFEFNIVGDHGEDVLFNNNQAFPRQPDNMMIELQ